MPRAFDDPREEMEYLKQVKTELDAATTKDQVVEIWKRHYLKVGHRKLGRLLVGRELDSVVAGRGRKRAAAPGAAPTGSEPM
jgi:hypothetical protein